MRSITAFVALFLLTLSFFFIAPSRALACDASEPMALRELYNQADLIVVATNARPGKWAVVEDDEYVRSFERDVTLKAEKYIKGVIPGPKRTDLFTLHDSYYQYKSKEPEAHDGNGESGAARGYEEATAKWADRRAKKLFFLQYNEDTKKYTEMDAMRQQIVPPGATDLYVQRLEELKRIYAMPVKDQDTSLVEWLVSMAENPLTRFEGASDLRGTFYYFEYEVGEVDLMIDPSRRIKRKESESASDTVSEADGEAAPEASPEMEAVTEAVSAEAADGEEVATDAEAVRFARALTRQHKERLIDTFLQVPLVYKQQPDGNDDIMSEADFALFELVSFFGDQRVLEKAMAELPGLPKDTGFVAMKLMKPLRVLFGGDEKLSEIMDTYDRVAYATGDELIEETDVAYDLAEIDAAVGENADGSYTLQIEKLPKKTYAQRQAELIKKIIQRYRELLAGEQA
jgi:hypothetical protein